jgi:phosphoribosyl 1,2-cyclic phosphodiesterase
MSGNGLALLTNDKRLLQSLQRAAEKLDDVTIRCAEDIGSFHPLVTSSETTAILLDTLSLGSDPLASIRLVAKDAQNHDIPVLLLEDGRLPFSDAEAIEAGVSEFASRTARLPALLKTITLFRRFELYFWGVRGTLPVSGRHTLRYGGSTSSISLRMGSDRHFIFDAGTGLRNLSRHVMKKESGHFNGRLFITHPHWDHLNCIPFFEPLYNPKNKIFLMGPAHEGISFQKLLEGQMNGVYFPIKPDQFQAQVTYVDTEAGGFRYDGIKVTAFRLDHPGCCLGYRIEHAGSSIAYITDNELREDDRSLASWGALVDFLQDVDFLIHDASYFDDEYSAHVHWGHSSVGQVVELALAASAKHLFLFHHDPEHSDSDIDAKLVEANRHVSNSGGQLICHNAREGEIWDLVAGLRKGVIR